ncbi:TatD family hydrolase [Anaerolentibacter hominis]|uniref:TatD family hydrolase n=1 Tax=Anaerolentibacter hominis TaxID=3079009 RepID=UPI0031B7F1A7
MIFETHAHYDDEQFDPDREELLNRLHASGIGPIVNVGANLQGCRDTVELTEQYPFIYGAVGVHPSETGELNEENFGLLRELLFREKIVAVGEIGLDYYWDEPDHDTQKKWFIRQLNLARELKMPVIIHSRDAAQDTYNILKQEKAEEIGGVIHCFSYSAEMAQRYVDMGFYIGVGGVVTFQNAKKLKEVVVSVPLERIVLETDSPYLAPVPNRGKRNCSGNLSLVVGKIAELKGITAEQVIDTTRKNAFKLYHMEEETVNTIRKV